MELQDLQSRWADYDRKLEANLRLNTRVLREINLDKVDSSLKRLSRSILFELVMNLGVIAILGLFLAGNGGEVRFLVPGIVLGLFSVWLAGDGIRQLVALHEIDYSASIVAIQKRLGALRAGRIRTTMWVVLLCPLLWTPLLVVSLKGLLGLDAYAMFDPAWLASNLLFGVAVIPLMVWGARRAAGRWQGSPFFQNLLDDIAGRSLVKANGFLSALSRFEAEEA